MMITRSSWASFTSDVVEFIVLKLVGIARIALVWTFFYYTVAWSQPWRVLLQKHVMLMKKGVY